MSEKILEPSEIIIEKDGTIKEQGIKKNPWLRFLARFFDYALFIFLMVSVRYILNGKIALPLDQSFIPIPFFAWIPVEALLLSVWGTTPGKFLLRITLTLKRRGKFDYMTALKRSFNVWFRGLGMGIFIINILCLMIAYHRFQLIQTTSWDLEEQIDTTQYTVSLWRIILAVIVVLFGSIFYFKFLK